MLYMALFLVNMNTRNAIAGKVKRSGRSRATVQYILAEFYNSFPTDVRSLSTVKAKFNNLH